MGNEEKSVRLDFSLEITSRALGSRQIALAAIHQFIEIGESEYLQPLKAGIDKNNYKIIYHTSHKLYGLTGRLKIPGIMKLAEIVANAAKNKKKIDYIKYYDDIIELYNEFKLIQKTL